MHEAHTHSVRCFPNHCHRSQVHESDTVCIKKTFHTIVFNNRLNRAVQNIVLPSLYCLNSMVAMSDCLQSALDSIVQNEKMCETVYRQRLINLLTCTIHIVKTVHSAYTKQRILSEQQASAACLFECS